MVEKNFRINLLINGGIFKTQRIPFEFFVQKVYIAT